MLDTRHNALQPSIGTRGCVPLLQLQVRAQERELAGAKAAIAVLESEAARLTAAKEERKRAEELLRKKWQQIVEFDDWRFALEALHNDLRQENDVRNLYLLAF
jgi:hypothetical protein